MLFFVFYFITKKYRTTEGEIRHTEIRNDSNPIQIQTEEDRYGDD